MKLHTENYAEIQSRRAKGRQTYCDCMFFLILDSRHGEPIQFRYKRRFKCKAGFK